MSLHVSVLILAMGLAVSTAGEAAEVLQGGPEVPAITPLDSQPAPRLLVFQPAPAQLAKRLAVIAYRAENLRIVPVYGATALDINPRVGHIHVTVDGASWHWADASNEPVILKGLTPGPHKVLIELANPVHQVIDSALVQFEIPPGA